MLSANPNDTDGIRALGLRKYRGMLLTAEQIQWLEETEERWKAAKSKWEPELVAIVPGITAKEAGLATAGAALSFRPR